MSLTLSLDFQYTTSIEKLWSALTDSSKLAFKLLFGSQVTLNETTGFI